MGALWGKRMALTKAEMAERLGTGGADAGVALLPFLQVAVAARLDAGKLQLLAQDLRQDLIGQMRSGASDAQIKRYLTDRYGDFILYKPPVKPTTWLLWFGPAAMFAIAVFVLVRIVRRNGPKEGDDAAELSSGDWE